MPSHLVRLAPAALLVLLVAGCPDTLGQLCPSPGTTSVGNFNLIQSLQPSAQQCVVYDGGVPAPLPDGGSQFGNVAPLSGSLCEGSLDGGLPRVFLALPNQVMRESLLGPNGEVSFTQVDGGIDGGTTHNQNVSQTPCGCTIDYVETISGILVPAGDAGIAIAADGGLTAPVAAIDGSVVDQVTQAAGATNCLCKPLPCDLHYQMAGTPAQ
jgi:hypothetical protein